MPLTSLAILDFSKLIRNINSPPLGLTDCFTKQFKLMDVLLFAILLIMNYCVHKCNTSPITSILSPFLKEPMLLHFKFPSQNFSFVAHSSTVAFGPAWCIFLSPIFEIILYPFLWPISLNMIVSVSIHFTANCMICSFLQLHSKIFDLFIFGLPFGMFHILKIVLVL